MALFDSIISETSERFDLTDDQSEALLTALLDSARDEQNGGLRGFRNRFRTANDAPHSSGISGAAEPFSKEQIESALGAETIAAIADRADLDYAATVSALTFVLPRALERLTPNGETLDEKTLLTEIEVFSGAANEAATPRADATKTVLTEAFDRIGDASENIGFKQRVSTNDGEINEFAAVGDRFSGTPAAMSDYRSAENLDDESNDDSPLKWLVPLILTALLVAFGFWFCGNSAAPPHAGAAFESVKTNVSRIV